MKEVSVVVSLVPQDGRVLLRIDEQDVCSMDPATLRALVTDAWQVLRVLDRQAREGAGHGQLD